MKTSSKCLCAGGHLEAGYRSDSRIGERSNYSSQVIGANSDITVAHDDYFVLGFSDQASHFCDFVVQGAAARTKQNSYLALREFTNEFFQSRNHRIIGVPDAEENFVVRIILTAIAGEVLLSLGIKPPDRFQNTHRR